MHALCQILTMRSWVPLVVFGFFDVLEGSPGKLRRETSISTDPTSVGESKGGKNSDSDKLKTTLCSKKVLSHMVFCDESSKETPVSVEVYEENLYPTREVYLKSVKEGHACQLPAPFQVKDASGVCCIPKNGVGSVWPNFCPDLGKYIGTGKRREYLRELDLMASDAVPKVKLPEGVYVLGRPDLPINYDKYHTSYIMMGVYVLITMLLLSFAVYVIQRLGDEETIVKGKQREGNFFGYAKPGMNLTELSEEEVSEEEDSLSEASSLSPAHKGISRDEQVAASVGQVSMSFGLLPGLPRGRSTNNSTLNSPRLTARERRGESTMAMGVAEQ